ncbi:MAG: hypothetical protein JOS17DRAFT_757521, partial [Linnemannia elongata]
MLRFSLDLLNLLLPFLSLPISRTISPSSLTLSCHCLTYSSFSLSSRSPILLLFSVCPPVLFSFTLPSLSCMGSNNG